MFAPKISNFEFRISNFPVPHGSTRAIYSFHINFPKPIHPRQISFALQILSRAWTLCMAGTPRQSSPFFTNQRLSAQSKSKGHIPTKIFYHNKKKMSTPKSIFFDFVSTNLSSREAVVEYGEENSNRVISDLEPFVNLGFHKNWSPLHCLEENVAEKLMDEV